MFKKTPKCEKCLKNEAKQFGFFDYPKGFSAAGKKRGSALLKGWQEFKNMNKEQLEHLQNEMENTSRKFFCQYVCDKCYESFGGLYYMDFERFFRSPIAMLDWLAHLNEKSWLDRKDFLKSLERLCEATGSEGAGS